MPAAERADRLAKLRDGVEREEITGWLRGQLDDLATIEGRSRPGG